MRQVAAPLGGRGKKFRVNLTQNLKVEGRKVAEWCRLVGREDKPAQVAQVSLGGRGNKDATSLTSLMMMVLVILGVKPIHTLGGV